MPYAADAYMLPYGSNADESEDAPAFNNRLYGAVMASQDLARQRQQNERQRRRAEYLRETAPDLMRSTSPGYGRVGAPNWLGGVASVLQQRRAQQLEKEADVRDADIAAKAAEARRGFLEGMSPREQLALAGLMSGDEGMQAAGGLVLNRMGKAEDRAEARADRASRDAAERLWREQQAAQQQQWQAEQRELQRQFQGQQNAAMRGVLGGNQAPIAVMGPSGVPMYVQRGEAVGMQPAPAGGGQPSEDERKAAGWLSQAQTAFANMEQATKKNPNASQPSARERAVSMIPGVGEDMAFASMSPERQQFTTAASSLSEAILRAATGAGVNKDEAAQKVNELTPRFGEDPATTAMKKQMAQQYLQSLATRAGRAAPAAGGGLPKAMAARGAANVQLNDSPGTGGGQQRYRVDF